jgi:hypothetical protein
MMNQIVMLAPQTDKADRLQISIHIQAEVLSAEAARREANYWLLENVGNLLRAENPELVLGDRLVWRIDIALTSPSRGWVGVVGRLEIDASSGEILANQSLVEELAPRAQTLIAN